MADIILGNTSLSKIYRGQTPLSKVYRGQTEIWTAGGGGGLPWASNYTIFYSADQSTDFTDQSGNGNNGTVSTAGSGGSSSVTHTGGASPYWEFLSPSPASENKYIQTSVSPGSIPTNTPFTLTYVGRVSSLSYGVVFWDAIDSGTDVINSGTSRTSNWVFVNARNGASADMNSSVVSTNTWYHILVTGDGAGSFELYLNNILDDSVTSIALDVSANITISRNTNSSTFAVANFDLGAWGWAHGHYADSTERTQMYNYYDALYSF